METLVLLSNTINIPVKSFVLWNKTNKSKQKPLETLVKAILSNQGNEKPSKKCKECKNNVKIM